MSSESGAEQVLPQVEVRRQRWPSPVWLIPLAALIIGGWLLFQYWQQSGETITVRFPSAEGIQAGSTEVRYKAVTVGKVKQVTLDNALNPLVTLSLSKSISSALECSAQFWVVRPRVRGAEISGLGTLFSGTYIGMIPARPQEKEANNSSLLCYEVLEEAPATRPERPGREYKLMADSMGSLDIGTPVFYKQLQVGEIINYRLSEETGKIEIGVFIDQPYYRFVNADTRFWNASGAEFKMDSVGAEFRMESLTSLIVGGITFETPKSDFSRDLPVSGENTRFELYPDFASSEEQRYTDRLYYTLYFNRSLRGLGEEAPVEFKGIKVGQVEKIKMHLDRASLDVRIPVLISIEPQRFSEDIDLQEAPGFMRDMVQRGLRAKLQNGNLLTGQMYISLSVEEDAEAAEIEQGQFYAVFPTSPTPTEELSRIAMSVAEDVKVTLGSISEFMESKKLDHTVDNLNQLLAETEETVVTARALLTTLEAETLPALTGTVGQVTTDVSKVMQRVDKQTLPAVARGVNRITEEVGRVSRRVDEQTLPTLARTLNQLSADTGSLMQQLEQRTLPDISKLANTGADSVTRMTGTVNKASTDFSRSSYALNKTMLRLQNSLGHLDRLLARNSPTQHQLAEMMEEVTAMARSVRILTEQLERQPESVIRGKRELR